MGRHSRPQGRVSLRGAMRFGPLEVAIVVASSLVFAVGLIASLSKTRTIIDLTGNGRCLDAQVEDAGSFNSRQLGRSADITYAVDGVRYHAAFHYYRDRSLQDNSAVEICTDPADPTTFAVERPEMTGDSTDLWLRGVIGPPVSALGAVICALVLYKHEWRFDDEAADVTATPNDAERRRRRSKRREAQRRMLTGCTRSLWRPGHT